MVVNSIFIPTQTCLVLLRFLPWPHLRGAISPWVLVVHNTEWAGKEAHAFFLEIRNSPCSPQVNKKVYWGLGFVYVFTLGYDVLIILRSVLKKSVYMIMLSVRIAYAVVCSFYIYYCILYLLIQNCNPTGSIFHSTRLCKSLYQKNVTGHSFGFRVFLPVAVNPEQSYQTS